MKMKLEMPFTPDLQSAMSLLPDYHARMVTASHELYCILEEMRHTPSIKQEDFDKLADIYRQLSDLSDKMIEDALLQKGGKT